MKMKAAIFSCSDFVEGNAASSRLRAYAKGLKELGIHASFFTLAPTLFNETGINSRMKGVNDGTFFKYLCGSNLRSKNFLNRTIQKLATMFRTFGFLLSQGKRFDVFYLYQPSLPEFLPVYLYSSFYGKPMIAEKTENELSTIPKTTKDYVVKFIHHINFWLLPHIFKHLVVISQRLKSVFVSRFSDQQITVIPAIVDLSRFNERISIRTNRIGYLGSFAPKDNVAGIIEAFAQAFAVNRELKLRLIGFDPYEAKHKAQINKMGLKDKVEKTGQVSYDQIPILLNECDLLIANKTAEVFSEYGFPTKLAEYLATGLPLITANSGDIPLFIKDGENGFLVDPGDNEALGFKILDRYYEYDKYDLAGKQGRKDCETFFDYKKQTAILKELLEKVGE